MRIVRAKLITRIKRTPTVESFRFLTDERINFIAGQFLQVIFDARLPGNKDLNKYLSFSCSPTKEYIEFTKRLSESQFSQKLKELKVNDQLTLKAPLGHCIFKEDDKKIGFLIGGIGITPVVSILEYIVDKKLDTDVVLLYSNRSQEETAFAKEFQQLQALNKNIKITYLISEATTPTPEYIVGRIDADLIKIKMPDIKERTVFIFGPPKMVEAMRVLAIEVGCSKENIKEENFVGY